MTEKRQHPRQVGKLPVSISHDSFGTIVLETQDIADGGAYISHESESSRPSMGDVLQVSLHGVMGQKPKLIKAAVVRVDVNGFALQFSQLPIDEP